MPTESPIEARILSTAAEILDLKERLAMAEDRLQALLKGAPRELASAIDSAIQGGADKIERRSQPPDLRQLLILIGASPGCSTRQLSEQTYGAGTRIYTARIRARLNHSVTAGLLEKEKGKRGGGWQLTELGRERAEGGN